jgi:hypothetical protein
MNNLYSIRSTNKVDSFVQFPGPSRNSPKPILYHFIISASISESSSLNAEPSGLFSKSTVSWSRAIIEPTILVPDNSSDDEIFEIVALDKLFLEEMDIVESAEDEKKFRKTNQVWLKFLQIARVLLLTVTTILIWTQVLLLIQFLVLPLLPIRSQR